MILRCLSAFVAVLAVCCSLYGVGRAAVISIDFGGEWIKVALVKPGVPMEIVLNKESKRKTAAVVSMRNNDRFFGDAALNSAVKYPKSSYRYLQLLIGQKFDSPIVQKYREWFPFYDIRKDEERGTILFQHDSDTAYTPEELVGMLFNNSRHNAEAYAGVPIRDVVITIPPFFNQAQRRAVIHAASLVGLNVLQLMSDNAAAALNYGLFRQASFNTTPLYIMFYDMGAVSTTTTIVDYRKVQVKEGSLANVHPQLTIKGTGFSRLLGGMEMDIRLQLHLAKLFEAEGKTKGSVYDSPRAMAKLLKEAKRVKQVLSANTDHYAQIEGLLEEADFRARVTRAEFEELCSDLLERVVDPVKEALEAADMTMDEIDNVVLMGGGTRVPKVQENLLMAVKKPELGKSLNTDEAIALGAVYQGAGHTKLFRVKKFIVKEGATYPIQVSFSRVIQSSNEEEEGEEEERVKTVKRTLFQRSNPYPAKKVLTFNRYSTEFSFQIFYGDLDFLSKEEKSYLGRLNISEVYLAGVTSALEQHRSGEAKGIKAHFNMDASGILNLTNVESVFEYPENVEEESTLSKIGSTLSNFFGMGADSEVKDPLPDDGEEIPADGNETETGTGIKEEPEFSSQRTDADSKEKEVPDTSEARTESETETEPETGPKPTPDELEPDMNDLDSNQDEETTSEPDTEPVMEEQKEDEPDGVEKEDEPDGVEKETPGQQAEIPIDEDENQTERNEDTNVPSPSSNTSNTTQDSPVTNTTKKPKDKMEPTASVIRVNLTAEITVLDLPLPSSSRTALSIEKLTRLHQRDEDKVANERAKNALESHIFETKDAMYSEIVIGVSTEDQREVVLNVLNEAADWIEDEGYIAETQVYVDKLKKLKKVSHSIFRRVSEAEKRPKLLSRLAGSLNISHDFINRMKNLSTEVQVFTKVEMTTLETLINETEEWIVTKLAEQEAISPHEEPVLLAYEIEEQTKRLDREIMYLLNKLRSHPPPKVKAPNTTNTTGSNETNSSVDESGTTPSEEPTTTPINDAESEAESETTPTNEAEPDILELPGTDESADSATKDVPDLSQPPLSPDDDPPHQEL